MQGLADSGKMRTVIAPLLSISEVSVNLSHVIYLPSQQSYDFELIVPLCQLKTKAQNPTFTHYTVWPEFHNW